jgi:hypothetical protein
MMALHPEEQSKIRAQIDEVCGEREPVSPSSFVLSDQPNFLNYISQVYEDFSRFTYALAAFNETLRRVGTSHLAYLHEL